MSSATIVFQKGSVRITVTFKDFNDVLFTPKTLWYRVTNANGKLIIYDTENNTDIEVTSGLATTFTKIFKGTQLDISDPKDDGRRFYTVYGTWDTQDEDDVDFVGTYEIPGGIKAVLGS